MVKTIFYDHHLVVQDQNQNSIGIFFGHYMASRELQNFLKAISLRSSPTSPCLFMGTLIEGEPPIYVGIYVDDIFYFSWSDAVEKKFESLLSTIGSVDFMGQVSLFLRIEFTWLHHNDGHFTVGLTQKSFTETVIDLLALDIFSNLHF